MAIMLVAAAGLYYALGETMDAAVLFCALIPVLGARWALQARTHSALRRLAQVAAPQSEGRVPLGLPEGATSFQRRAGVLLRRWDVVVIALGVALFGVGLASDEPWMRAGLAAVTFAIAAVPAGVAMVPTLFVSVEAWRLVSRNVVVRRLPAMETLGSATVISVDDTVLARPEAVGAIAECQRAGIRVVVVTADDKPTARTLAETAGLPHDDASIVTGEELESLRESERGRESRIQRATIFARMSPAQKFLLVDGLQRAGGIVVMTGDGIDDGPSLRRADVGIVGERGTDGARAAADVVLREDNLSSIVDAIRASRHVLQNSQRALLYLLSFQLPVVVLAAVAPLAGAPLAVLPIHLVWLGLLSLSVAAGVFQAEAASRNVMTRPPRDAGSPLLPNPALARSALSGAAVALGAWVTYTGQLPVVGEAEARATALVVLLGANQALMFAERLALPGLGMDLIPRARAFWLAWCASAASFGVVLYVPAISQVFSVEPPAVAPMLAAFALGVLGVVWRLVAAPRQSPAPADGAR